MSSIARQIAGASPAERLAEFQRIEPNLRKQFQEHLVKEGRPGDFDKEFPAILEQAKEHALISPAFGKQAARARSISENHEALRHGAADVSADWHSLGRSFEKAHGDKVTASGERAMRNARQTAKGDMAEMKACYLQCLRDDGIPPNLAAAMWQEACAAGQCTQESGRSGRSAISYIAGPAPLAQVDASKVTARELTAAMESAVKPKFVQWCAEEKVADAETAWKAKLPKLTEDFKASKHFGRSVLAVRESILRCDESVDRVKVKFDEWAAAEGLSLEEAARKWVNVEAQVKERHEEQRPALKETTTAGSIPSSVLANASKGQAKKYGSWKRDNGRAYQRVKKPGSLDSPYNITPSYEEKQARFQREMDAASVGDPLGRNKEEKRREEAELALRRRARGEFKTESRPTSARSMIDSALDR